jgi:hypothetical protein
MIGLGSYSDDFYFVLTLGDVVEPLVENSVALVAGGVLANLIDFTSKNI